MRRVVLTGLALLLFVASVGAEPPVPLDDRAEILRAEMRRDAADLSRFLKMEPGSLARQLAIRALGRIGDDGTGPGMLRDMLNTAKYDDPDLRLMLWAGGIIRSKELIEPLKMHLDDHGKEGRLGYVCQAARSLGWTGAEDLAPTLTPHLRLGGHVAAAALIGLGRGRAADREILEGASRLASSDDADLAAAADYACWLMAGAWRGKQEKPEDWAGEPEIAKAFLDHLKSPDANRRMGGIRVLGSLLPPYPKPDGPFASIYTLVNDPDPRVIQDAIWRIYTRRQGAAIDAALIQALNHADPKTRHLAADALGKHASPAAIAALEKRFTEEPDARMREVLAIELVRVGKEDAYKALVKRDDRPSDRVVRQMTDAQALLVSKRPEAMDELLAWADPGASQRTELHAAVWMTILGALEGKQHAKLEEWLMGYLNGGYAIDRDERPFVIGSAVSLVGKNKIHAHGKTLLGLLEKSPFGPPHEEIRMALMGAFAGLAKDEACPPEIAKAMKAAVTKHMTDDESPWVRRSARDAAKKLELEDVPTFDAKAANGWKGVPRASEPWPGVDPAGDSEWLNEKEILQIADWIARTDPLIAFETTAGTFVVKLDPHTAPVHCVSLLNGVRNGIYADTRWHRVVPNFVIQGGDPHGHGAGNGGWTLPDELSPNPYVRGALGMPKSVKDDGGAQIFVMHTTYHPLDERYTVYANVTSGMATVDKIRVGDLIKSARVIRKDK